MVSRFRLGRCRRIGINVTALDDTSGPDLVPIHASFRDNAVHWLPPVPETEHSTAG
ncbi:hypothetical protein ABZ137_25865 [Streptomyces bobili]|uniref:hypothetical protein n=1 Tax=Streptomyces bobili TaxID=67280 RepID=UPI0033BF1E68